MRLWEESDASIKSSERKRKRCCRVSCRVLCHCDEADGCAFVRVWRIETWQQQQLHSSAASGTTGQEFQRKHWLQECVLRGGMRTHTREFPSCTAAAATLRLFHSFSVCFFLFSNHMMKLLVSGPVETKAPVLAHQSPQCSGGCAAAQTWWTSGTSQHMRSLQWAELNHRIIWITESAGRVVNRGLKMLLSERHLV